VPHRLGSARQHRLFAHPERRQGTRSPPLALCRYRHGGGRGLRARQSALDPPRPRPAAEALVAGDRPSRQPGDPPRRTVGLVDGGEERQAVRPREVVRRDERPVICITQARLGSTRLPGKVLMPIIGRPLLAWHLSRLGRAKAIDQVIVATTVLPQDDAIVELCRGLGIPVFRGSQEDVLERYLGAAARAGAATIVRVTSDCPLIDPGVVDELVAAYHARRPAIDYATLDRADFPRGLDADVFSRAALEEAGRDAHAPAEREH